MANEHNETVHHGTVVQGNLIAIFAYLGILILIPLFVSARHDPFVKFHIKQGLALIIFDVVGWIIAIVIGGVPFFGGLITSIWAILSIVFVIVGILNVLNGQEKDLPLIGSYGHRFTF